MSIGIFLSKRARLPLVLLLSWLVFLLSGLFCVRFLADGQVVALGAQVEGALEGVNIRISAIALCLSCTLLSALAAVFCARYKWALVVFILYLFGYGIAVGFSLGVVGTLQNMPLRLLTQGGLLLCVAFLGYCYAKLLLLGDIYNDEMQRFALLGAVSLLFFSVFLQTIALPLIISNFTSI